LKWDKNDPKYVATEIRPDAAGGNAKRFCSGMSDAGSSWFRKTRIYFRDQVVPDIRKEINK
jgi:hypothetical protein